MVFSLYDHFEGLTSLADHGGKYVHRISILQKIMPPINSNLVIGGSGCLDLQRQKWKSLEGKFILIPFQIIFFFFCFARTNFPYRKAMASLANVQPFFAIF